MPLTKTFGLPDVDARGGKHECPVHKSPFLVTGGKVNHSFCEGVIAVNDDVAVVWANFHHEAGSSGELARNQGSTGAAEAVEYDVIRFGEILQNLHMKLYWLLCRVNARRGVIGSFSSHDAAVPAMGVLVNMPVNIAPC